MTHDDPIQTPLCVDEAGASFGLLQWYEFIYGTFVSSITPQTTGRHKPQQLFHNA
jgi:hypothetical protein